MIDPVLPCTLDKYSDIIRCGSDGSASDELLLPKDSDAEILGCSLLGDAFELETP